MEVPDSKLQFTERKSTGNVVGGIFEGHAAKMLTPGALMSGCKTRITEAKKKTH